MTNQNATLTASKINDEDNLVPENTILIVTEADIWDSSVSEILYPLKGVSKRDWFVKHAYFCLPLVTGNQYGFAIKSAYDFEVIWNGGETPKDLTVTVNGDEGNKGKQIISSHFGMGVITVQNRFHFRTPLGVNMMTMDAPNVIMPYFRNMTGVVETDNLRRDFTFNIRVTVPNVKIQVKKGDIISCVMPIPRFFVDKFTIKMAKDVVSEQIIKNERQHAHDLGLERSGPDKDKPGGNGRRYHNGIDVYGNKFYKHQKSITDNSAEELT
jgi:hypothetical protein